MPYRRILVATDFSEASAPAWEKALAIAGETGSTLTVVHVIGPSAGAPNAEVTPDEWERRARVEASEELDRLVAQAGSRGVQADRYVIGGYPEEAIFRTAKDLGMELIVLGTHGRRGVSRLFLGSVASRVVATASCPVLTVGGRLQGAGTAAA